MRRLNVVVVIFLSFPTFRAERDLQMDPIGIDCCLKLDCGTEFIEVTSAQWTYRKNNGPSTVTADIAKAMKTKSNKIVETELFKSECDNKRFCEQLNVRPVNPSNATRGLELSIKYKCYRGPCPNDSYKRKHNVPNDQKDLEAFAASADELRKKNDWKTTNKMTLFTGAEQMTYRRDPKDGTKCTAQEAAKRHVCTRKSNNIWKCEEQGEETATHDTETGHYELEIPALERSKTA